MVLELAAGVIEVLEPIIFIVQKLVQELVQEQFLNALEQFFRGDIIQNALSRLKTYNIHV